MRRSSRRCCCIRYRWLQAEPLPAQRPADPAPAAVGFGGAAGDVGAGASERGFFSLLGVMERGNMLPADEIRDLIAAANQSSAAMAATAAEVVSMERAATGDSAVAVVPGARRSTRSPRS